ncbi:MAG: TPM domain-containing protein [Phenylobacterium sp.]|uniref:TPM domain-containing protein n=1 Tax=Phenylobacterium sp. TaxID=1871053 RepID=UPI002721DE2D|nr:TPM domain-containing protein [Phenylobacterium sp.]MDO8409633.1 TPM domain-containing protein [Phenylobacterium sp.]
MRSFGAACALAFGLVLAIAGTGQAQTAPTFPALSGRVVDGADMLSPQTEAQLTQQLAALESATGRQLVVVTLPDLQGYEIEDYGYQLGRHWGIGEAETDSGALFIVAPNQRKVRIEVGYGLEPILTDALSSTILQAVVLPQFRNGEMEAGVIAGTQAIIDQLALPEDEALARAAAAAEQPRSEEGLIAPIIFVLFIVLWIVGGFMGAFGRGRGRGRGRRRGGSSLWWLLPLLLSSSGGRGGGGGGGGFGGGGFSGGGGGFGGGGSSGSW